MNTKTVSPARRIVLAALFLALAFLLPMVTGHVPQVGNMLCPMHFPILLCGFVLGGPWGLAVGFVAPLLRSVLFGMPPMFPIAVSMAFELAAYGLVSGLVWRRVKHTLPMMYAALVTAMVAGRLVWGAVRFVLAGLTGSSFPFSAFLSGALLTAVPGILAQLVLIPLILEDAARYDPRSEPERYSNRLVPVYPGQGNDYDQDTSILILNDHGSFGTVESISVLVFSLLFPLPGNTDSSLLHQKDFRYYPGMSKIIVFLY